MLADIFDALTSERPCKKPFSLEKAFEIMQSDRGVFIDPELLDLFMDNRVEFFRLKEEFGDHAAQKASCDEGDKLLFAENATG